MIAIRQFPFIICLALLPCLEASADTQAVTTDGRHVLLKDDQTWEYVEVTQGDPSKSAILSVVNIQEMNSACRLDLRMQNNLGYKIRSLVPRFTVYNQKGVLFESRSKSFGAIKPTRDQYHKIQFNGIGCSQISWVKVHDADHCTMGKIDKFNDQEGECLGHIFVQPSDLINFTK